MHCIRATKICQQPVLLATVAITGLLLGVRQLGWLQSLELGIFDQMVRLQPQAELDPRLLIVEISEPDIQTLRQWPLSDQTIAIAIAQLQRHHPKVIGLDLYRDIPNPPGHERLVDQLKADNIIAIEEYGKVPSPPSVPNARIGFNDLLLDLDGTVRRSLLYTTVEGKAFYSLPLRLSLYYLAQEGMELKVQPQSLHLGETHFTRLTSGAGGYQNQDVRGYQILPRHHFADQSTRKVTLTEVLRGEFNPAWVRDKVILMGTTASSGKDLFFTPHTAGASTSAMTPGVTIHAQVTSQILSTVLDDRPALFWFWPDPLEALWIGAWALLGSALAWRVKNSIRLSLTGMGSVGTLVSLHWYLFLQAGWVPLVSPLLAFAIAGIGALAYRQIYHARRDPLTKLANQTLFDRKLRRAIYKAQRHQHYRFAVLFLGLDRFKIINEGLGHQAGDQILLLLVERLKPCLRDGDTIARIRGDEFAILLEQIITVEDATSVADRLQIELNRPLQVYGKQFMTTFSLGLAFSQPGGRHKPDELLRDANTAMYRAKAAGKACYEVFSLGMREQALRRLELESDLRQALERQELLLYYQPIVTFDTGKITGFEALVRWQHPKQGLVFPGEFIHVAEETGLIIPMGQWIFQTACRQLKDWHQQFPKDPSLLMSINLSGAQFTQSDLVEVIAHTLRAANLEGHQIKLELTESMMMANADGVIALLLRLKSLNLKLGIDDFGTGYSSLSYLHRFPMDTLKIDRSFVSQMDEASNDAEIVRTIIMLSHTLGLDVIAEGIETQAQLETLRQLGCEHGQGYFLAKPLSSEAATALLAEDPQW